MARQGLHSENVGSVPEHRQTGSTTEGMGPWRRDSGLLCSSPKHLAEAPVGEPFTVPSGEERRIAGQVTTIPEIPKQRSTCSRPKERHPLLTPLGLSQHQGPGAQVSIIHIAA